MRKLPLIIAPLLLATLFFTSCKKDYTCKCTVTSLVLDTSFVFTTQIDDSKKKHAEAECDGSQAAYQQMASLLFGTATCNLEKD